EPWVHCSITGRTAPSPVQGPRCGPQLPAPAQVPTGDADTRSHTPAWAGSSIPSRRSTPGIGEEIRGGGLEPGEGLRQHVGGMIADVREHQHPGRSEEHTSELQSRFDLVCRLLLEKQNETTG